METTEITTHVVRQDQTNSQLKIKTVDEKGAGGAYHRYAISWQQKRFGKEGREVEPQTLTHTIHFQEGPIGENGVNGITQEALLAIVIHRLECFQEGEFANPFNQAALEYCEMALAELKRRTEDRLARGVEGKNVL